MTPAERRQHWVVWALVVALVVAAASQPEDERVLALLGLLVCLRFTVSAATWFLRGLRHGVFDGVGDAPRERAPVRYWALAAAFMLLVLAGLAFMLVCLAQLLDAM